jgi:hypothetical protein
MMSYQQKYVLLEKAALEQIRCAVTELEELLDHLENAAEITIQDKESLPPSKSSVLSFEDVKDFF